MKTYYRIALLILALALIFMFFAKISEASSPEWYKIKFSINQRNSSTNYLDPLIAKEVIIPVLKNYDSKIDFFFFERLRGLGNKHCFMFYFFSKKKYAHRIFHMINDNKVIQELKERKLIELYFAGTAIMDITGISGLRGDSYAKTYWAHQMYALSNFWLVAICQISKSYNFRARNLEDLINQYKQINQDLYRSWHQSGLRTLIETSDNLFDNSHERCPTPTPRRRW